MRCRVAQEGGFCCKLRPMHVTLCTVLFLYSFFQFYLTIWQILYQELHQHMQVTDQVIMFRLLDKIGNKRNEEVKSLWVSAPPPSTQA